MWTNRSSNNTSEYQSGLPQQPHVVITAVRGQPSPNLERPPAPGPDRGGKRPQAPVLDRARRGHGPGTAGQRLVLHPPLVRPHPPPLSRARGRDEVDVGAFGAEGRVGA